MTPFSSTAQRSSSSWLWSQSLLFVYTSERIQTESESLFGLYLHFQGARILFLLFKILWRQNSFVNLPESISNHQMFLSMDKACRYSCTHAAQFWKCHRCTTEQAVSVLAVSTRADRTGRKECVTLCCLCQDPTTLWLYSPDLWLMSNFWPWVEMPRQCRERRLR